jgi:hypothetical protein
MLLPENADARNGLALLNLNLLTDSRLGGRPSPLDARFPPFRPSTTPGSSSPENGSQDRLDFGVIGYKRQSLPETELTVVAMGGRALAVKLNPAT